ncbi:MULTISPECIES: hypothetical protein [unclassified Streptomyces]|uniref:hypothetical protein n=1 Tax=unclassified Streptomyces TaxID=2593676 RepID=UPI0033B995EA
MAAAESIVMDQGAAAVWAATVAGFSSAAGAAIGSALAGRSARSTAVVTVEAEKAVRYEDGRKQSYTAFRSKVNTVFDSLTELIDDLRNDRANRGDEVMRAVDEVRKSLVDDVVPCHVPEVENVADILYVRLQEALPAVQALLSSPQDAKDGSSLLMLHLGQRTDDAWVAYKAFSSVSGKAIYER